MESSEDSFEKIKKYYDHFDEWRRLDSSAGIIEQGEVVHVVATHISQGAHILDLGAGPGRYAIEFAKLGYRITLLDLSKRLVDIAKEKFKEADLMEAVNAFHVLNAIQLAEIDDDQFDAIFSCGPFYHIVNKNDRIAAAREALRVCKTNGTVIIGFIPRFSGLAGLIYRAAHRSGQVDSKVFRQTSEQGVFHNSSTNGFQEGYYPTVAETKAFWKEMGLLDIKVISSRSFIHQNEQHLLSIRENDPELFQTIIGEHRRHASNEAFIEAGGHALLIGRKGG